ncbi:MAG: hypothetical protein IJX31_00625 [Clostridia bacterium]|nr:hypothetical protein [Clostridia bacterium]
MEIVVQNKEYGTVIYEENVWTGKKKIKINDVELQKTGRNKWTYEFGGEILEVSVKGSFLMGAVLTIGNENIQVTEKPTWYSYVLSVLTVAFVIIWGASVTLVKIFPIVGGALGGAISALYAVLNLYLAGKVKSAGYKLLIGLGMFVAAVLTCYLLGVGIFGRF